MSNMDDNGKLDILDRIPCAACILKNDSSYSLLYGNERFYQLFGCTEEELQYKYGNRLSALTAPESLKEIGECLKPRCGQYERNAGLKVKIKRGGKDAWIYANMSSRKYEGIPIVYCTAFDITESELALQIYRDYEDVVQFITEQTDFEVFGYDLMTREVEFFATHKILTQLETLQFSDYSGFEYAALGSGIIHPDYEDLFCSAFEALQRNGSKSTCELKMKNEDGKYVWVLFTLVIKRSGLHQGRLAIGILENITPQKEASLNYLTETQFFQSMLSEKDAYAQVDVTEDRCTRFGGLWNLYNEVKDQMTYSDLIEEFINKVVHPEDRKHYLELMDRDNFVSSLENGIDKLGCEFRRIVEQNKMVWMGISIHLFKDPFSKHVLALLYLTNIDDIKKLQKAAGRPQDTYAAERGRTDESHSARETEDSRSESSESSFNNFLAEQGDIAYLVDTDTFQMLCANQALYDRLGITQEECCGKTCYELMQKRDTPCPFCSRANWSTDKFYLWKNMNVALEQEFLIKNKLVQWQGREVLLAIAVDISNDKSIVDLLENEATESHSILSGIQRMTEASDLAGAIDSALETIGYFFRANSVCYWTEEAQHQDYICLYSWSKTPAKSSLRRECWRSAVTTWLRGRKWDQPVMIENEETMLCYSYDMYKFMNENRIRNQRWLQLNDGERELGYISIENISSNFQNIAFLESFSVFIIGEIKKRSLMEGVLYSAFHDDLTGLLSRKSYENYMLDYSGDKVSSAGVVIANINNLKGINNSRGFHYGNHFIKQFASILKEAFENAAVFRLDGDEFLVIATDVERVTLEKGIQKVRESLRKKGSFTVSIGCSWDNVENDLAVLIEQATEAMKVNKKRHYDSEPFSIDLERGKMLSELITSLENGEFEVFLQPKVDLARKQLVGSEALIRYHSKELGIVTPDKFIDMLEKNNFIRYVDLFVFEEVCKVLEKWKKKGAKLLPISLNFSRLTLLESDILSSVRKIVSKYDVSRRNIEIEITESFANMGKSILYQVTHDLYEENFSISLDDFGTKYTNLSILADIDFDTLKLDKSLISTLEKQKSIQIILKNIIDMCEDLNIKVIAEGIETKAQEEALRQLDCRLGQGYLYGRPMPIAEFERKYIDVQLAD